MSIFHRCDNCGKVMIQPKYVVNHTGVVHFSPWWNLTPPVFQGEFCSLKCVNERGQEVAGTLDLMAAAGPDVPADQRGDMTLARQALRTLEAKPWE